MAKMTDKHKMTAYILNKELGYSMTSIAILMKVSQSTISSAIKDISYRIKIQDLTNELEIVKRELCQLGYEQYSNYYGEPVVPSAEEFKKMYIQCMDI